MRAWILAAVTATAGTVAGCATTDGTGPDGPAGEAQCTADDVQTFIGQKATAEAGQDLLRITGARQLRWVPPRTAVTMDFRADRLTVSYDDDMLIDRVSCG